MFLEYVSDVPCVSLFESGVCYSVLAVLSSCMATQCNIFWGSIYK